MHDLIQEMAWEIVRGESIDEPGLRSRLCHRNDIFHVFLRNTGTKAIKGIRLCLPELEEADSSWNCESFSKMFKLTFLELNNLIIHSGPKFLPDSLRNLIWSWYPSRFLPQSYRPNLLVELIMNKSKLVRLWDGKQDLPYLKTIDLSRSKNLTKTPDLTGWNNSIFSMLRRMATQGISPKCNEFSIVSPGSKISKWFNIQSEGDSLTVELPPDQNSMWMGITFCVVFAEHENPTTVEVPDFRIRCFSEGLSPPCLNLTKRGHIMRDHLWVCYMPRRKFQDTTRCHIRFLFETYYSTFSMGSLKWSTSFNIVKKSGARLVYEQDLKELLNETMNIYI
ncbi:hypothetical protein M0R45_009614 [Rubus argutus]|uniref:C-JID domain-containing protein n=1 Tax=Rubus argutus TaxID=59490 RepID=A0AAW1Y4P0_RUBAR